MTIAGVVHEDVAAAEGGERLLAQLSDLRGIRHVVGVLLFGAGVCGIDGIRGGGGVGLGAADDG